MTDRFDICIPYVLAEECPFPNDWSNHRNYSDDPGDSGGPTMCGITHREYDLWRRGHSLPVQDVIHITKVEGYEIYRVSYWLPHCPLLKPGLDLFFFDTAVNMGSTRAVKLLQASLGITVDGLWGPVTEGKATAITDAVPIIRDQETRRQRTYESFGGFARFGRGWLARDHKIGEVALQMAHPEIAPPPPVAVAAPPETDILHRLDVLEVAVRRLGGNLE